MPLLAPKAPEAPARTKWWVTDLYWLCACAWAGLVIWFLVWLSHRRISARPRPRPGIWLPSGTARLGLAVLLAALVVWFIWVVTRPNGGGMLLGRTKGWFFRSKVYLSLRASCSHAWIISPIGGGKTTLLTNLILGEMRADPDPVIVGWRHRRRRYKMACKKLGKGRACVVIDPNGALTKRVRERCTPEEWARVTVIDPLDDHPPIIDLFGTSNPETAAEFILSLFRALPGGGTVGPNQLEILRLGVLDFAQRKNATLLGLPRFLKENCGDSAQEQREVRGLCSRLGPFFSPSIAKVIGRKQDEDAPDIFSAIDSGRTIIVRMRPELSRPAASLLAAVVLGCLLDRILRREPDAPHRHLTIILDELGAVVREGTVLSWMLDQVRSRNVGVFCAHQRISQLIKDGPGLVDALRGSALTRIVWRLADFDEAAHMAKHLTHTTAEQLMHLPDYTTLIRRRAKGRPILTKMYDMPKRWKPAGQWRVKGPLRSCLTSVKCSLRRGLGPLRAIRHAPEAPSAVSVGVSQGAITTHSGLGTLAPRPETPAFPVANKNQSPVTDEQDLSVPSSPSSPARLFAVPPVAAPAPSGLRPTSRDLAILAILADQGIATTLQIGRAWWPGRTERAAQMRLKALTDAKLIERLGPNGRPDEHYALTAAGAALIGLSSFRPVRIEDKALPHRLAVVDFGTALLGAVHAQQEAHPGQGWDLTWQGESVLRNDPSIPEALRPDSRIVLSTPAGKLTAWVEIDRGTEGWSWLGPKLERLAEHGGADAILVAFSLPGRAANAVDRMPRSPGIVVSGSSLQAHIASPLAAIWTPAGGGDRLALPQLAR